MTDQRKFSCYSDIDTEAWREIQYQTRCSVFSSFSSLSQQARIHRRKSIIAIRKVSTCAKNKVTGFYKLITICISIECEE